MNVSGFIAGRIRFKGRLCIFAIALSFLTIIIAVSVSSGFRKEIRKGVSDLSGDVILCGISYDIYSESQSVSLDLSCLEKIAELGIVRSMRPVIYRAGIVKAGGEIQGIMVKGVESADSSMHVRIPSALASTLNLKEGDPMLTYFVGDKVKMRKFKVAGIYESLVEADGTFMVYAPLSDLQRLNGWDDRSVSAVEVTVDEALRNRTGLRRAASEIGTICMNCSKDEEDSILAVSAGDKYGQLFDWLDLIDFNVLAILVLMTAVAGFNMISGLLILLFRHISTIGTLKAMGMSNKGICSVFLRVSARIVLLGLAIGNAAGLLFCLIQGKTHLIRLNPENYFISYVPVNADIPYILISDAAAFAAILLLTLLPCLFISKVDPSETVKTE